MRETNRRCKEWTAQRGKPESMTLFRYISDPSGAPTGIAAVAHRVWGGWNGADGTRQWLLSRADTTVFRYSRTELADDEMSYLVFEQMADDLDMDAFYPSVPRA